MDPDAGGQRPRQQGHRWCRPPDAHSPTPGGPHPSSLLPSQMTSELSLPWAWPQGQPPQRLPSPSPLPHPHPSPAVPSGSESSSSGHLSASVGPLQARNPDATRWGREDSHASVLRTRAKTHMSTCRHMLGHFLLSIVGPARDSYVSAPVPPVGHVVNTSVLHIHIWELSFEVVCLSVSQDWGSGLVRQVGAGQGRAGGQRLPVNDSM